MTEVRIYNPVDELAANGGLPPEAEPPVRLGVRHGPAWPVHVLTPWARNFVYQFAVEAQVPVDLVAQTAMALFSSALTGKFELAPKRGSRWTVGLNLYLCTVAQSGERKSLVVNAMQRVIVDYERELAAKDDAFRREQALEIELLTAERSRVKSQCVRSEDSEDREAQKTRLVEIDETLSKFMQMHDTRLRLDNVTPEALVDAMSKRRGRVSIISAEAGLFEDLVSGRYGNGNTDIDPFLKGFSGDSIQVDRKTSGERLVEEPRLTIAIMAQPQVMEKFGRDDRLMRRGLTGRFLFSWPESKVGFRDEDAAPVEPSVWDSFYRYAADLFKIEDRFTNEDTKTAFAPRTLHFSTAAQLRFKEFVGETERRLRPDGDLRIYQTWGNRLGDFVARLAGILAVLDHTNEPPGMIVEDSVLQRAIELGLYYLESYRTAMEGMSQPQNSDQAAAILGEIEGRRLKRFQRRELQRRLGRKCPPVEVLKDVLDTLVQRGHLLESDPENGKGGPVYQVNVTVVPGGAAPPEPERIGPYLDKTADST